MSSSRFQTLTLPQLQAELERVREEIRDMPQSHSQSNPSYVLDMRSLNRRQDRILEAIAALKKGLKTE